MDTNKRGWIKLHRTLLRNPLVAGNERLFYVWVNILLLADLDGVIRTGRINLGKTLGINPRTLYDILHRFEKADMLKLVSTPQFTTVTITHWEEHQQVSRSKTNRFPNRSTTGVIPQQTNMFGESQPTGSPTLYKRSIRNKNNISIDQELAAKEAAARKRRPSSGTVSLSEMYREMQENKQRSAKK